MLIGSLCTRPVVTTPPNAFVDRVAARMGEECVGAIVVVEGRRALGIVSDRDIAVRCVGEGLDPRTTKVERVMTYHPRMMDERTSVEHAVQTLVEAGVRRLLVTGQDGRLIGLISFDDLIQVVAEQMAGMAKIVEKEGTPTSAQRSRRVVEAAQSDSG